MTVNLRQGVVILLHFLYVQCFNIDVDQPLIFKGKNGADFGFTSGMIKNSEGIWLIVGSPRDNFTDRPQIISPGNVYKCPVNLNRTQQTGCEALRLRTLERTRLNFRYPYEESKELLGGSLVIAGNTIVVCAPHWKDVRDALTVGQEYPVGYCYQLDKSLRSATRRPFSAGNGFSHQLMTGFSSAISQFLPHDVVLGMPGVSRGIGVNFPSQRIFKTVGNGTYKQLLRESCGIVMCQSTATNFQPFYTAIRGDTNQQIKDSFKRNKGSYIGYSVASGYFGPSRQPLIVASAPHYSNTRGHVGSVLLLDVNTNTVSLTPRKIFEGDQIGSSFGASLLVLDVNGDDIHDLLIGSPQYYVTTAAIDQGKVDVYHGTGSSSFLIKNSTLKGLQKPGSRFGTALGNLGDITDDNFNDIAVGAPFEDDLVGAVYIFNGGRTGINPIFSQRISGKTIQNGLKSFGWHISQSMDIDNNLHDDVSVGSYMSDAVVVLRSRPVVDVSADIILSPTEIPLNGSSSYCTGPDDMPCVTIVICYRYTARGVDNGLGIDYELKADAQRLQNRRSSRLNLFLKNDSMNHGSVLRQRIRIAANGPTCETIFGRVQALTREFYRIIEQEISFMLNFSLAESQSPREITPIISIHSQRERNGSVRFARDCAEVCTPDLSVHMSYSGTITAGRTTEQSVSLEIKNTRDTSYATSIYINVSNNTEIIGVQSLQGSSQLTCNNTQSRNSTIRLETNCDINGPLRRGNTARFSVRLNTSLLLLLPSSEVVDLESNITLFAQVSPRAIGSTENNVLDNSQSLQLPIQLESNVQISGVSQPDQRKTSNTNFQVVHMYEIYNGGPSPLPVTSAVFLIPVMSLSGRTLIQELNLKVSSERAKCTILYNNPVNNSNTMMTSSTSSPETSTQILGLSRTMTNVTCDKYQCARIECKLLEIASNNKTDVRVSFVITEGNLDFKSTDLLLNYHTVGTIYQPTNSMMVPWSNPAISFQVFTQFFPETVSSTSTPLNIGVIIGACVGGFVAFIILGVILWKVGFFDRKKQEEAKELKRKSIAIQKRRTQMMAEQRRTQMMVDSVLSHGSSRDVLTESEAHPENEVHSENEIHPELYPQLS